MRISAKHFESEKEIRTFIESCEKDFEDRLDETVMAVSSVKNLRFLGLSGPTCAGKTTLANKLISEIEHSGKRVHAISIDDFYFSRDKLMERAEDPNDEDDIDLDSVKTIDLEEFYRCIEDIKECGVMRVPRFDFKTGTRVGYAEIEYDEDDVFIFEGIQVLYPELLCYLKKYPFACVYISPESSISIDGVVFEPNEIRLLRRLVRDSLFRDADADLTFLLWKGVRKNEDENIFPNVDKCDFTIDSTMGYDINVLKPYLVDVLTATPKESKYYERSLRILEKIKDIEPIDRGFIPDNSLYTEFIGHK